VIQFPCHCSFWDASLVLLDIIAQGASFGLILA
jgi:hypothetical protein